MPSQAQGRTFQEALGVERATAGGADFRRGKLAQLGTNSEELLLGIAVLALGGQHTALCLAEFAYKIAEGQNICIGLRWGNGGARSDSLLLIPNLRLCGIKFVNGRGQRGSISLEWRRVQFVQDRGAALGR